MTLAERHEHDRRERSRRAINRHFAHVERRVAERRTALSQAQGKWTGAYDRACSSN